MRIKFIINGYKSGEEILVNVKKINTAKKNILVVGDIMLDRHIWGDVNRISPEAPVPVVEVTGENMVAGGASNVLNNVLNLNSRGYITGIIGDDEYGMILVNKIEKAGGNAKGIVVDDKRPTTTKTRIIAHSQQVVRIDRENCKRIDGKLEKLIINYIRSIRDKVDAVIIEDYGKGVITKNIVKTILKIFNKKNIPIAVDPKEDNFNLYKKTTIITPNKKEAENIVGRKIKTEEDLYVAGREIIDKLKLDALLITRGKDGMSVFVDDEIYDIPTIAKEEYDVTGAGDTVIATLTTMLANGYDFKDAAFISNVAAGIVVEKPGVVPVKVEELKERLKNEKPNIKKISR